MSFPKYPKYKKSDFEWLGEVPSHWEVKRLGHFFSERREKVSDKEYAPLSVTKAGIVPRLEHAAKTQDGENRKKVCKGDFVINSRSDRKGSAGLSPQDGSVSLICIVLSPDGIEGTYTHHLLRSTSFQEEFYRNGKGIVADLWSTGFAEMKNIVLAVPSRQEQTQITRFLDHETAKIDALIREQERLIELLGEKRQAVISHAVTKGLAPDVLMKDSGVEWLGEVPAHWRTVKIRYVAHVFNGTTPSKSNPDYWLNGTIPWVSSGDLNKFQIDKTSSQISELASEECNMVFAPEGSVLVGLVGQGKTRGLSAKLNIPSTINQNVAAIVPDRRTLDTEYLHRILQHLYPAMRQAGRGGQQAALNCELVSDLTITIPSKIEQQSIVNYLENTLSKMEVLMNQSKKQITLLKERRSNLISAAVTGKIDVRNWQPPYEPAFGEVIETNEEATA